ncbi:MAG TPA: TadE family protein [Propionibacteriaceae bacterium]
MTAAKGCVGGSRACRPAPARGCQGRQQRGSASVELALVVPALVLMLGLMVAGGRLWFARTIVVDAAQTAARSASLARTAGQAAADGRSAARQSLATAGLRCDNPSVTISTAAFAAPAGTPASIDSTIICVVPFADVLLPRMPGSVTVTASGTSALDTYRSRR